jgi:hypothetical protein
VEQIAFFGSNNFCSTVEHFLLKVKPRNRNRDSIFSIFLFRFASVNDVLHKANINGQLLTHE